MKKELVIKYKGKKQFVSYGSTVYGIIGADKYRLVIFNTELFDEMPELKEAYDKVVELVDEVGARKFKTVEVREVE